MQFFDSHLYQVSQQELASPDPVRQEVGIVLQAIAHTVRNRVISHRFPAPPRSATVVIDHEPPLDDQPLT